MKVSVTILKYVLLSAFAVVLVFPIYWMLTGSIKPSLSLWASPPEWFPKSFTWLHFDELFNKKSTLRWLFNSVFTGLVAVLFILMFCAMAGYAYAKKKFPGHQVLFFLVIATMMMPRQVTLVPLYILISDLGLLDSYGGLILPIIAFPFGVFLIRQFVRYIPDELLQAASMDGAGELRIFGQIIFPLMRPALGALAIFAFMAVWNDYIWQLIVLQKDSMKTLPLGVSSLIKEDMSVNYGLAMAGGAVAALPLIALFLTFQKSFINGIALGTEK
ncbi:carbohydrate ABC transporter permease [Paenibacillus eucommiae]|uniref:Multiple sugar transport system permease protein n=1 Tax=Paenibacillus eucommiae TaxID=1355755 RepID=A0ABS4J2E4_9BACL|nr:carbohydrate ABC transporter permease [Paenibacillus eucommiae]MBP1993958.1 multiple sugar transport system permease protein [Paenibacillus eucommiae]